MKIRGNDPETGSTYESEASDVNDEFIDAMSNFEMSDDQIKRLIDKLEFSADVKSLLYDFSRATIKAGEFVLKIGRKILDFIGKLLEVYPNATFGLIFGAIVGVLMATIPIVGIVLGPIATPIAMALGLLLGLSEDIKDKNLIRDIARVSASFSALKTE